MKLKFLILLLTIKIYSVEPCCTSKCEFTDPMECMQNCANIGTCSCIPYNSGQLFKCQSVFGQSEPTIKKDEPKKIRIKR